METVLITGASSGIGKETARKLLAEGYIVYVAARRLEEMKDLEARGATALAMDISEEQDIIRVVDTIRADRGGIDVLVNNAGFGMYGAMEDTSIDDARYQFEVNLFGLARLTQLALPYMRKQRAGKIVNMSSMGGKIYTPLGCWYHASKHALEGWSDCLRIELEPFGIDVIIIEPGAIETEFGDVMTEPMLERSGNTAYAALAHRTAEMTRRSFEPGYASPPSVVADAISTALKAKRPKIRYVVGKLAKPLIYFRRWFGDRAYDQALRSRIRTTNVDD